jgi:hypothetical protein
MLEQVSGAGASILRLALAGSYGTSWTVMVDAGTEPSLRMMCTWPLPGSTSVGDGCPGTKVYTHLAPDLDIRDFDISPDGSEVVLERVQERSEVVLLDLPRQ